MAHLLLFVFVAILLCTAQLCLGLWIGAKFGRIQEQRRSTTQTQPSDSCQPAADCSIPWTECLILISSLMQQVQNLSSASTQCRPALPDQISLALCDLQRIATALQQQITARPATESPSSPGRITREHRAETMDRSRTPLAAPSDNRNEVENCRHVDLSHEPAEAPESLNDEE